MFLVNSRLGLFTATTLRWHPFSQSYGVILPSSLERVISRPLVFLPSYLCRFRVQVLEINVVRAFLGSLTRITLEP